MQIVISQSMYFPWMGFIEQLRLADTFVLYDDVQFSKGSFTNRVQIKTATGPQWLSVPLMGLRLGQRINDVQLDERSDWRTKHRDQLSDAYRKAPFVSDMLALVDDVFAQPAATLSQLAWTSTLALADYFGCVSHLKLYDSASMQIDGSSSQRVLDIVRNLGGSIYITGHGARNYLNHASFEKIGVDVRYMDYRCEPYVQLHGEFTPYVSALDLVANCGRDGRRYMQSSTNSWKVFTNESK